MRTKSVKRYDANIRTFITGDGDGGASVMAMLMVTLCGIMASMEVMTVLPVGVEVLISKLLDTETGLGTRERPARLPPHLHQVPTAEFLEPLCSRAWGKTNESKSKSKCHEIK